MWERRVAARLTLMQRGALCDGRRRRMVTENAKNHELPELCLEFGH